MSPETASATPPPAPPTNLEALENLYRAASLAQLTGAQHARLLRDAEQLLPLVTAQPPVVQAPTSPTQPPSA